MTTFWSNAASIAEALAVITEILRGLDELKLQAIDDVPAALEAMRQRIPEIETREYEADFRPEMQEKPHVRYGVLA